MSSKQNNSIQDGARRSSLTILFVAAVFTMSLWFSAAAILPQLNAAFTLSSTQQALLTNLVQIGFVVGSLLSAFFVLADRVSPKKLFFLAALLGGTANLGLLVFDPNSVWVLISRFLVGLASAGLYPVGMKMALSWSNKDAGLLVGMLVGALTLGSAFPHLLNWLNLFGWQSVVAGASILAFLGGVLILSIQLGPNLGTSKKFDPQLALKGLTQKAHRLANFGYFGHMFELYAMWAWFGLFAQASLTASNTQNPSFWAAFISFIVIGVGAVGAVGGGWLADRKGRTFVTMLALAISGLCCVLIGFTFGLSPIWLTLIGLIWGVTIIADSAQFSASIAELSTPDIVGTMLSVQTALGFAITLITIQLVPLWVDLVSWQYAFAPLALGPLFGFWAMARLRKLPEARKIANGLR